MTDAFKDGPSGSFAIRKASSKDRSGSFYVHAHSAKDRSASITIRNVGYLRLSCSFTIRKKSTKALSGSFTIRKASTKDLGGQSFTIRKSSAKDLTSSIDIHFPNVLKARTMPTMAIAGRNSSSEYFINLETMTDGSLKVAVTSGMTNIPTLIASTGAAQTSTASYVSLFGGAQGITVAGTKILIDLFEQNVNAVLYQVKAGPTPTSLHTLVTDQSLAKNGDAYEVLSDPFMYVDVLIKDAVGGVHGSVMGYMKRG